MICDCGNDDRWWDVQEAKSGSMFYQCKECGRLQCGDMPPSVDWGFGMLLQFPGVVGSAWTQDPNPDMFCESLWSVLTTSSR